MLRLGEREQILAPLERALAARPADAPVTLYACGPDGMLHATAATAAKYGRPCEVSVERIMGCGMGGCYSCVIAVRTDTGPHYVRSCLAGPVFDGAELVWH